MKIKMPKAIRRTDWQNYLNPEDQKRVRDERTYRISSRLDAMVDRKGGLALVLHNGPDYVGDTILSKVAMAKLACVLKTAARKEP